VYCHALGNVAAGIDSLSFKIRETLPQVSSNRPTPLGERTYPEVTIMMSTDFMPAQIE